MPKGTILLVEDDEEIRGALAELLMQDGYPIVEARNGREALRVLGGGVAPSLILLDLNMPVMSGHEFLAAIAGDEDTPPIVVLTAGSDPIAHPELVQARIQKPIDLDALAQVIEVFCDVAVTQRSLHPVLRP